MSFVLDHSVALAWCFEDEQTPAVMELLDRVAETGASAPSLWPLEALNGLLATERRRRVGPAQRATLAGFLHELPIMLDGHSAEQAWEPTMRLALHCKLTVYDATYLEPAQRRRLPLASLGQDLPAAAMATGVEVLGVAA